PGALDVTLNVEAAATAAEAAKVYPADHWWALLEPPAPSEFRAGGGVGTGPGVTMESQAKWLDTLKLGCNSCHQVSNATTGSFAHWSDEFKAQEGLANAPSKQLWERRLRTGVRGSDMYARLVSLG